MFKQAKIHKKFLLYCVCMLFMTGITFSVGILKFSDEPTKTMVAVTILCFIGIVIWGDYQYEAIQRVIATIGIASVVISFCFTMLAIIHHTI